MKAVALVLVVALGGLAASPGSIEELRHQVDARAAGAAEAGHVWFSWAMPGEGTAGHALVAAFEGGGGVEQGKLAAAWGLWSAGGGKQTGALSAERLTGLRQASQGSLVVRVDAAQLERVSAAVLEWSSRQPGDPDEDCENLVYRLIPLLGIKAPYRPGFAAGDPFALLRDLARLNR